MQRSHPFFPALHLLQSLLGQSLSSQSLLENIRAGLRLVWLTVSRWLTLRVGLGLGLIWLAIWHGKLLGAIAIGLGVAVTVYLAQINRLHVSWLAQVSWPDWRRLWRPANRPLTIACLCGSLVTIGGYQAAGFRGETDISWIALALLLQGVGTVGTLGLAGLLLWQWRRQGGPSSSPADPTDSPENAVANLSAPDPVKRLMAIHQLMDGMQAAALRPAPADSSSPRLASPSQGRLRDYFRLRLTHEPEPVIRRTLQSALEQLSAPHERFQRSRPSPYGPLQMPQSGQNAADSMVSPPRQGTPVLMPELQNVDFT